MMSELINKRNNISFHLPSTISDSAAFGRNDLIAAVVCAINGAIEGIKLKTDDDADVAVDTRGVVLAD